MFLLFRPINKLNLTLSNIKLNEYLLTLAKSVAYLGIEIDETLFWNNQIKVVAKKLSKTNGTLLKLRYTFQRKIWHKFTAAFSSRTFYTVQPFDVLYLKKILWRSSFSKKMYEAFNSFWTFKFYKSKTVPCLTFWS